MSNGEFNSDGIKMLHKTTGKFVDMEIGGNPSGKGQRYNVNHKYLNYMQIGYYKTAKGQEVIEMKTDGPNHGDCKQLPQCCWSEVDLAIQDRTLDDDQKVKAGQFYISCEHPHPKNHPPPKDESSYNLRKTVNDSLVERWIGFAVCAWQEGEYRHIQGYVDPNPFDSNGKPANNWILGVDAVDKGDFTTPELAKRKIPLDFNKGLEAEIRMHGDTKGHGNAGGTDVKFAKVYEIVPPV